MLAVVTLDTAVGLGDSVVELNIESTGAVVVMCCVELREDNGLESVMFWCAVLVFCSCILLVGVNNVVLCVKAMFCAVVLSERITVVFCVLVWRTVRAAEDCGLLIVTSGVVLFG